jgi:hypothetical protein
MRLCAAAQKVFNTENYTLTCIGPELSEVDLRGCGLKQAEGSRNGQVEQIFEWQNLFDDELARRRG